MRAAAYPVEAPPPTPVRFRRRLLLGLVGAAVVLTLVGGGLAVLVSGRGDAGGSPRTAVDAYYAALVRVDPGAAFARLCSSRRTSGLARYADVVRRDVASGTGIARWRSEPQVTLRGDEADVAGTLRLDDGLTTPITVTLLREEGHWGVCSSNLGGILPGPRADQGGATTT